MSSRDERKDVGRTVLYKHGWIEGKGLGRNETGMKEAIKVGMKQDTAGLGHDYGKEFTHMWWDHIFNKAASRLVVESSGSDVQLKTKAATSTVSSGHKNASQKKKASYSNFVKGAVLTGCMEVAELTDDVSPVNVEETTSKRLTDDELVRVCGGRTAHKAARHGFKLNGKLLRIEEQERGHDSLDTGKNKTGKSCKKQTIDETTLGLTAEHTLPAFGSDIADNEEVLDSPKRKKKRKKELV